MEKNKPAAFDLVLERIKSSLIRFLKTKAVKAALKKILGSAVAGGPYAWIVTYIVSELYDEVAKPIIQAAFEKLGYAYEVKKGEIVLRRIENAETNTEWRDSVRDS